MKSIEASKIKVTLLRGCAGKSDDMRRTLVSLGLKRVGSSRVLPNVNPILGQINKVIHLIKVEAAE